ncbi:BHLH domain-containing protein [Mycena sanguinolenta]|uniref:BHLH domain-containing protein n=1 Tax=Mycena sanguinolenta TaxID=230812 RepID=A0A8H7DIT5_9AGAR|nr:BHLH domain-containing protein [Mycena sanguinolenta]
MPSSSSSSSTGPYAACVNPPAPRRRTTARALVLRRPLRPRASTSPTRACRPKLTKAAASSSTSGAAAGQEEGTGGEQGGGAKRGRKPATLSRTAREAQRKLNHSIIEKARRTKINDALATLKTLVPPNYGQAPPSPDDDNADGDGDYDGAGGKNGGKGKKGAGKREEKEKEFKLEILEANKALTAGCANCAGPSTATPAGKRKRNVQEEDAAGPTPKRVELDSHPASPATTYSGERLPSISSWLPSLEPPATTRTSPVALIPTRASPEFTSHLPSPPSSTQFPPARAPALLPPALNLGPIATQALLSARTPEDESAAACCWRLARRRRRLGSSHGAGEMQAESRVVQKGTTQIQIQTPASLLGLK